MDTNLLSKSATDESIAQRPTGNPGKHPLQLSAQNPPNSDEDLSGPSKYTVAELRKKLLEEEAKNKPVPMDEDDIEHKGGSPVEAAAQGQGLDPKNRKTRHKKPRSNHFLDQPLCSVSFFPTKRCFFTYLSWIILAILAVALVLVILLIIEEKAQRNRIHDGVLNHTAGDSWSFVHSHNHTKLNLFGLEFSYDHMMSIVIIDAIITGILALVCITCIIQIRKAKPKTPDSISPASSSGAGSPARVPAPWWERSWNWIRNCGSSDNTGPTDSFPLNTMATTGDKKDEPKGDEETNA